MAVPKRKQSHSRSAKRRSHRAIKPTPIAYCPKCGNATRSHAICPNCGYYQGRTLVEM